MPRPKKRRRIRFRLRCDFFKPAGIPLRELEEEVLELDEMETLRLRDVMGYDQNKSAKIMNLSQSSFQRILASARKKISIAVVKGKAIKIKKEL